MNLPYLYLLNMVLIARLFTHFRDERMAGRTAINKTLFELAALLPLRPVWVLLPVTGMIIGLNIAAWQLEKNGEQLNGKRLLILLLYFILLGFFAGTGAPFQFKPVLEKLSLDIGRFHLLGTVLASINWNRFLPLLFGLLLTLNEANLFVRYFFEFLQLAPRKKRGGGSGEIDLKEYNRGRVIGFLERTLIYFFVISGQFAAIGFIIAAKGVTRFKELQERNFAEYFLIGTLLSVVVSGGIGLLVGMLLK